MERMDAPKEGHSLELKVMRLTRPTMFSSIPITCDPHDLPGNTLNQNMTIDLPSPIGLGNLLMLPQSFGVIYLGETFSCYMSVHNDSPQEVYDVWVKADLQTQTQKIPLTEQGCHQDILEPDKSIDEVIKHEVKEAGTHILVCSVTYKIKTEEVIGDKNFRKFFKFKVSKPLDVKTKFYSAEDHLSDEVYLEALLLNTTGTPICLETVSLEPSPQFTSRNLNMLNNKSVFGPVNCLNPKNSRQYLFCLTPKPETAANLKLLKELRTIGKLDIVWRSTMGERGRLQTSQLERMAPGFKEVQIFVEKVPSLVQIEKPFEITLRLTNACERALDLVFTFENSFENGFLWQGISGIALGKLEPEQALTLKLEAIPILSGIRMLSGLSFRDRFLNRHYDAKELAQVFISPEDCTELIDL